LGQRLCFVIKLIVEKSIESTSDARTRQLEKALERKSTFEVLSDRFSLVAAFSARPRKSDDKLEQAALRPGRA
jgi:hypothetical protein